MVDARAVLQAVHRMRRAVDAVDAARGVDVDVGADVGDNLGARRVHAHGWSLGGAVAARLAAGGGQIGGVVVSDRSFASLGAVGAAMTAPGTGFGAVVGAGLASLAGAVVQPVAPGLPPPMLGAALGLAGGVTALVGPLLQAMGWELNALEAWQQISPATRRLALYHPNDGIIPYESASLAAQARGTDSAPAVAGTELELRLPVDGGQAHMYWLDSDQAEWGRVLERIRSAAAR